MSLTAPTPTITVAQLRILLEAIEQDPSLYNAGKSDMITFLNMEKWLNLAYKLNDDPIGAHASSRDWKYALRCWSANIKRKIKSPEDKFKPRRNPYFSPEDDAELTDLENRFYDFIKQEESREIVDVTYEGKLDGDPTPDNEAGENSGTDGGIKFVVQLVNVFDSKSDENTSPKGPKKRTIVMRDDDLEMDPSGSAKKFKIMFDQSAEEGEPEPQVLGNQLDTLQLVSRDLEENISTIKSRIHMIKDMWKHRCGDN